MERWKLNNNLFTLYLEYLDYLYNFLEFICRSYFEILEKIVHEVCTILCYRQTNKQSFFPKILHLLNLINCVKQIENIPSIIF